MGETITDALGLPIKELHWYGYTQSNNGVTKVVIGTTKFVDGTDRIQLTNVHERCGLYMKLDNWKPQKRARSVSPALLFYVSNENLELTMKTLK